MIEISVLYKGNPHTVSVDLSGIAAQLRADCADEVATLGEFSQPRHNIRLARYLWQVWRLLENRVVDLLTPQDRAVYESLDGPPTKIEIFVPDFMVYVGVLMKELRGTL